MTTDFKKIAENAKDLGVHVSPEGVDEKIVKSETYMITQTEGGKFRVYALGKPVTVAEDREAAEKSLASGMLMFAGLVLNPKATIDAMFNDKKKPE